MHLIDSHCHLNFEGLSNRLPEVFANMEEQSVKQALAISVSKQSFAEVFDIAQANEQIYCTIGVHPDSQEAKEFTVAEMVEAAKHPKVVDLPVIVHTRDAAADTLAILKEGQTNSGVIHCFTEDTAFAKAALDLGLYISFSGIVTFKNAPQIQEAAKYVPADRMLVETDAPFLAPVPKRGKPNEPSYVRYTAEFVAKLRGESVETLAAYTSDNFYRLFNKVPDIRI